MQHTHRFALVALLAVVACTPKGSGDNASEHAADTASVATGTPEAAPTDTIVGHVGDGTSMHNLELLSLGGDTMEYELSDDVDRRADLMVGNAVAVVVRHEAGGIDRVVATLDPGAAGVAIPEQP